MALDIQSGTLTRDESVNYFQTALKIVGSSQYVPANFYSVDINRGNIIDNSMRNMKYLCDMAELPGRILSTSNQRFYGPVQKFPMITSYNDLTLSFICLADNNMYPKTIFEDWLDFINPKDSWNLRYKSEYKSTITISQYVKTGEKIYTARIRDAFPIAVYPMQLSFSSPEHHSLRVTFAYTYFEQETNDLSFNDNAINLMSGNYVNFNNELAKIDAKSFMSDIAISDRNVVGYLY